jgi:hypothetical protein
MGTWQTDDGEVYDDETGDLVEVNGRELELTPVERQGMELWHVDQRPWTLVDVLGHDYEQKDHG